jgi:hypothetical protein
VKGDRQVINTSKEKLNEIVIGNTKYLHSSDTEYDYLKDNSNNQIKVNLRFTKSKEKNEEALKGLKTFFTGIS